MVMGAGVVGLFVCVIDGASVHSYAVCHHSTHAHTVIFQLRNNCYYQSINQTTTDVLQSEDSPNKFFFYEVYENADAIAHHKLQPHYLAWGEFKESGGTVSSVSKKAGGIFMT
jgi:hypothetical protein